MDKKKESRNDAMTDVAIIVLFVVVAMSYPPASALFIILILAAIAFLFSANFMNRFLGLSLQMKNGLRLAAYALSALAIIFFLFDLVSQVKLF